MNTYEFSNERLLEEQDNIFEGIDFSKIKVVFHVGIHKSGTTWMQEQFFQNSEDIIYCSDINLSHKSFLLPRFGEFSPQASRKLFMKFVEQSINENKPLIISNEALSGLPFAKKYVREHAAIRIFNAFPSAKIIISVREQINIIRSMYSEYLRYGYSSTFQGFIDQDTKNDLISPIIDLSYFDYFKTINYYSSIFGDNNVKVLPFEWIILNFSQFLRGISEFIEHDISIPRLIDTNIKVRPSNSSWAKFVLRVSNKLIPQDSRWRYNSNIISPNHIAYHVDRITPRWLNNKSSESDLKLLRASIKDFYLDSNARFQKKIGIELGDYGYNVG